MAIGLTDEGLKLIVEDEYEGTTGTTQDVGQSSLEESFGSLSFVDLGPAVQGVLVHNLALGTARLHHHTTTDSVEGIRDDTGGGGHNLGDHPLDEERSLLGIGQHTSSRIVQAEVSGTVDDNALHGDVESTVQTDNTVSFEGLGQAVSQTGVLALSHALADISTQPI